ncbi:MAG: hypothetical protein M1834_007921 [Cirrosporium novae-zelandiae]|nr:MAG: hypothetical protein M1834_007921 [Cirrosporium novae-zelandiae]
MKIQHLFLFALWNLGGSSHLIKRTGRTSNPDNCLVVRGSSTGTGEYSSLGDAVDSLGSSTDDACIFIYSGTYTEQVIIDYGGNLTLYGYTSDTSSYKKNVVTFTHSETSSAAGSLDASSTVQFKGDYVKVYNINFENSYGSGSQAVAVTANGDYQGYYGCSFSGYQDTLYAKAGNQYYSNCYIEGENRHCVPPLMTSWTPKEPLISPTIMGAGGAVDFIFGDAAAWFGECTIAANGAGYITANSRQLSTDDAWYVIDHSTVKAASGYDLEEDVYLGRPWRVLARVIYQYSTLSDIINPKGWATMADGATPEDRTFEEYENSGDGSDTSEREYETSTTSAVTKTTLFGSGYKGWIDTSY